MDRKYYRRSGITVLEVVIVIAIFAILTGLMFSAIQRVREDAMRAKSANNLRLIILGVHQLADQR
jgi:type II secretory pathway pseudopilin PulG